MNKPIRDGGTSNTPSRMLDPFRLHSDSTWTELPPEALALQELNIACAQALGWRVEWGFNEEQGEEYGILYNPEGEQVALRYGIASLYTFPEDIPPFPHDPTAARVLEGEIKKRELTHEYAAALYGIVTHHYLTHEGVMPDEIILLIYATPEQRARAFLEAVGVPWKTT